MRDFVSILIEGYEILERSLKRSLREAEEKCPDGYHKHPDTMKCVPIAQLAHGVGHAKAKLRAAKHLAAMKDAEKSGDKETAKKHHKEYEKSYRWADALASRHHEKEAGKHKTKMMHHAKELAKLDKEPDSAFKKARVAHHKGQLAKAKQAAELHVGISAGHKRKWGPAPKSAGDKGKEPEKTPEKSGVHARADMPTQAGRPAARRDIPRTHTGISMRSTAWQRQAG